MQRLGLIRSCLQQTFRLGLGDPSLTGLGLTVLYVAASLFMLRKLWLSRDWLPRERLLWGVCTAVLVLMTVNKQMDLQQTVVLTGRCVAEAEGWLDRLREVQRIFGMIILALVAAGVTALVWSSRFAVRANWPLLLGMALLLVFVVLQVVRFEKLNDGPLRALVALRLHRMFEGAGLATLLYACLRKPLAR